MTNPEFLRLSPLEQNVFQTLVSQVATATGKPAGVDKAVFDLGDARLELLPVAPEPALSAVLFVFTLTGFKVVDAATLAQLLNLNRSLLVDCSLPACFCLDASGNHVQFQQRMRLDSLPVWALERYVSDSLKRLRDLFVLACYEV